MPSTTYTLHRLAGSALLAALLAGCAGMHGIGPGSTLRQPATVKATATLHDLGRLSAAWPQDEWWRRYGDAQLDGLVLQALSDSPSMHAAQARMRQAAALAGLAESARSPQVTAGLKDTRQRFSENSNVPKPLAGNWYWVNDLSVSFSYELDFWGKNASAVEAAVGRVKASEADSYAARLLLTVGVTQAWLRLDQLYSQLDLDHEALDQREHILELTRQRVAAGIDSQVELRQAEAAVPAARAQIAASSEAIALVKGQLAALAGQGPDRAGTMERPRLTLPQAPGVPDTLAADLLGRRPDIVALRWRVEALACDIKVARAQFYPSINLSALVGVQALGFDRLLEPGSRALGAGSAISLPLFDGGRLRSNLAGRSADYDLAVEQYNQGVIEAVRDVVAQLTSLKWLDERREQQDIALDASQEAYQLALQRYRAGLGNYLQVLVADSQVLAQRRAHIDLAARAYDLDLNLTRALGGGYRGALPAPAARR